MPMVRRSTLTRWVGVACHSSDYMPFASRWRYLTAMATRVNMCMRSALGLCSDLRAPQRTTRVIGPVDTVSAVPLFFAPAGMPKAPGSAGGSRSAKQEVLRCQPTIMTSVR